MTPAFIMHHGRIMEVVAMVKQNGIPHVAVMIAPDRPLLVPLARATPAAPPQRRAAVRLATLNGERV